MGTSQRKGFEFIQPLFWAINDQSDAWVGLTLTGGDWRAAMARLAPLDLAAEAFAPGCTARSLLGHMPVSITAVGNARGTDGIWLFVMRSYLGSAVHDLTRALRGTAARAALGR